MKLNISRPVLIISLFTIPLLILSSCSSSNKDIDKEYQKDLMRDKIEGKFHPISEVPLKTAYERKMINILFLIDASAMRRFPRPELEQNIKFFFMKMDNNFDYRAIVGTLTEDKNQIYIANNYKKTDVSQNYPVGDINQMSFSTLLSPPVQNVPGLKIAHENLMEASKNGFFRKGGRSFIVYISYRDDHDFSRDMNGRMMSDNFTNRIQQLIMLNRETYDKNLNPIRYYRNEVLSFIPLVSFGRCIPGAQFNQRYRRVSIQLRQHFNLTRERKLPSAGGVDLCRWGLERGLKKVAQRVLADTSV